MLHNVFQFEDKVVREVTIPRPDMIVVVENTTIADFLQTFSEASHSRFPLYADSIDHITAFIAIKDVLRAISSQGAGTLDQPVRTLARTAICVPEAKHILTRSCASRKQTSNCKFTCPQARSTRRLPDSSFTCSAAFPKRTSRFKSEM